jgi:hypothetical protein
MTINEIKQALSGLETIAFELPNGTLVPNHFHVTEVGKINKDFIDCGGTRRSETKAAFQLWQADDYDHRLHPEKLVYIIELSQKVLDLGNEEIEVEYQGETISKYGLDFDGKHFKLTTKHTDCLARENCAVPSVEEGAQTMVQIAEGGSCTPNSGCC